MNNHQLRKDNQLFRSVYNKIDYAGKVKLLSVAVISVLLSLCFICLEPKQRFVYTKISNAWLANFGILFLSLQELHQIENNLRSSELGAAGTVSHAQLQKGLIRQKGDRLPKHGERQSKELLCSPLREDQASVFKTQRVIYNPGLEGGTLSFSRAVLVFQ